MSTSNSTANSKRKVKLVSSNTKAILNATNPEIFETSPRAGGYLKVTVPTKSLDDISCGCQHDENEVPATQALYVKKSHVSTTSSFSKVSKLGSVDAHTETGVHETCSREFRLTRAIAETDWEITAMDETETVVGISDPYHDSVNMLAITISCVMLMASQPGNIDEDYFTWSESYLHCMKDDQGIYPPNIRGILNHILYLKMGSANQRRVSSSSSGRHSRSASISKTSPESAPGAVPESDMGATSGSLAGSRRGSTGGPNRSQDVTGSKSGTRIRSTTKVKRKDGKHRSPLNYNSSNIPLFRSRFN